jgi:hypothetical protein
MNITFEALRQVFAKLAAIPLGDVPSNQPDAQTSLGPLQPFLVILVGLVGLWILLQLFAGLASCGHKCIGSLIFVYVGVLVGLVVASGAIYVAQNYGDSESCQTCHMVATALKDFAKWLDAYLASRVG